MLNYPSSLTNFIHPGCQIFSTRDQAAATFKSKNQKDLPPYDIGRPYQPWMETRVAPPNGNSVEAGYQYNVVGIDKQGFYRMETDGIPYTEAIVPNMPGPNDPPVPANAVMNFPLRKLGPTGDGGLELVMSSPFGVEIGSSKMLDESGLLTAPPDVLAAIQSGTYVPPGVD